MIGLLDCNNFFVSCERLFRPDLTNKPAVVLSSNDGMVIARSQEVKDLGVPMGVAHFHVRDIFKEHDVVVFSGNHRLYRDISRRVMAMLTEHADDVYQYSVDEAFFKLEDTDTKTALAQLAKLKAAIEKAVGVPVSIGAGDTMTIAKYASEKEKRGTGLCVLQGKDWIDLTPEIALSEIWGVGGQTAKKMRQHNLLTVQDLLATDRSRIEKVFGVHGLRLRSELSETPAQQPGERSGLPQSIMSTRSFSEPVSKLADLEAAITRHTNDAAAELREAGARASVIRVILGTSRHGDWFLQGGTKEVLLLEPTDDTRLLLQAAFSAVKELFKPGVPYKKAGVVLGHITPAGNEQLNIFSEPAEEAKGTGLMKVLDSLNKKLGSGVVSVGRIRSGGKFAAYKYRSPEYTTKWSDIRKIKSRI